MPMMALTAPTLMMTVVTVIARDPWGFRPLCYAMEGPLLAAASESVALLNLGFAHESIHSVDPGEMISVSGGEVKFERFAESPRRAHCFFEWVYLANVASTMDDRSVYLARQMLGEELARLEDLPIDADTIVVPVPDTSKCAADSMAFRLGDPRQAVAYLGRTQPANNATIPLDLYEELDACATEVAPRLHARHAAQWMAMRPRLAS